MTFHKRFYLHVNSSLWKLMTVQESMGGLVNFCLWKSSDRHHLINQTKLLKNIHVYNTGITQHDLAITNIFNSSIRLTFLTQSSALIWGKTQLWGRELELKVGNLQPRSWFLEMKYTYPRLGILESQGTRGLRDQLVREICLFHDVFTNVVDPTVWSNINIWGQQNRDFFRGGVGSLLFSRFLVVILYQR